MIVSFANLDLIKKNGPSGPSRWKHYVIDGGKTFQVMPDGTRKPVTDIGVILEMIVTDEMLAVRPKTSNA